MLKQYVIPYIKQHVKQILLGATGVLIIIGLLIMWWSLANEDNKNVINLSIEDGYQQSVTFENITMIPGESCTYTLRLSSKYAEQYTLSLDFVELEEKTLKEFAYVRIELEDQILYDCLLKDAFEDDTISLPVDLSQERNTQIVVVYYLPIEVGNEAQNAEAIFELLITASNTWE